MPAAAIGARPIALASLVAAAATVVLALTAGFLQHPWLFAFERASIILAPVLIGLYWCNRRPTNPFGRLLIALGFLAVPVTLEAASEPWLHAIGVLAEAPLLVATFAVILAFPTGRLDGRPERAILGALLGAVVLWYVPFVLLRPTIFGSPLAACTADCPANPLQVAAHAGFLHQWRQGFDVIAIVIAVAAALLILRRGFTSLAPHRRTFLAGSFVSIAFLVAYVAFVAINLREPLSMGSIDRTLSWTLIIARTLLPLGFLVALVQAELFAGRVLRTTVEQSLQHRPIRDVEATLARALGDPDVRLAFWVDSSGRWIGSDGTEVISPREGDGRTLTHVSRGGVPAAAILHDATLENEPELLQATTAAALLVFENAALEAELHAAIRQLRESRARLVTAGDYERRRLERDIHDGAQQQLVALRIKLALAVDLASANPELRHRLAELRVEIDHALDDLRELAHGLFPALLADEGLLTALHAVAIRSALDVRFVVDGVTRYSPDVEAAVYYCCLEALQNSSKHAGSGVIAWITLRVADGDLYFGVRDDGCGFDDTRTREGTGFANMRDRVGALDGMLAIDSTLGRGTTVSGRVPAVPAQVSQVA